MRGWLRRYEEAQTQCARTGESTDRDLAELARDIKAMWTSLLSTSIAKVSP